MMRFSWNEYVDQKPHYVSVQSSHTLDNPIPPSLKLVNCIIWEFDIDILIMLMTSNVYDELWAF